MTQDATPKIVDALLTLIFRLGLWPCRLLFYPQRLPIHWLWVNAVDWSLDYMRCNTPNSWCSADALLTLCWRSVDALLTLCWRWFLRVATSTLTVVPTKEANTSIMGKSRRTGLGLSKMQHPQLLTLCWRSFSEWRCDYVAFCFANKGCQYVDYG